MTPQTPAGRKCEHQHINAQANWTSDGKGGTKPDDAGWWCFDCGEPFAPRREAAQQEREAVLIRVRLAVDGLIDSDIIDAILAEPSE